jgi:hypothetical protein
VNGGYGSFLSFSNPNLRLEQTFRKIPPENQPYIKHKLKPEEMEACGALRVTIATTKHKPSSNPD